MMMTRSASLPFGTVLLVLALASPAWAQPVNVTYQHGLLSIDCTNAPIASVFESIRSMTGIELIVEDEVKSKSLTASLTEIPLAMAIQRLLEGSGVNYIVMMDARSWGQVSKVFIGAGGGGPARSAPAYEAPMDEPEPDPMMEEAYEEPMDLQEPPDFTETDPAMENQDFGPPPEDFSDPAGTGEFNPPGSSPIPDFLPPAPQYPRSSFTPGLPGSSNRSPDGSQQQQPPDANSPPPATFPFTDPFGRPIPIPPGMNEQQQQQQQQGQPRRQQQQ